MELSLRERDRWIPAVVGEIERALGILVGYSSAVVHVQLRPIPFRSDPRWVTVRVGEVLTLWVHGLTLSELCRRLARQDAASHGLALEGFPGDAPPPCHEYLAHTDQGRGIRWGAHRLAGPLLPIQVPIERSTRATLWAVMVGPSDSKSQVMERLILTVGSRSFSCGLSRGHEYCIVTVKEPMSEPEIVPCRICIGNLELPLEVAVALREGVELQCTIPESLDVILQVQGVDYALGRLTVKGAMAESSLEITKLFPLSADY